MGFLKQYYVNHYNGLDAEKPLKLNRGDFYFAEDTKILYKYDNNQNPQNINGQEVGALIISQTAANYAGLVAGTTNGELAYVYNSEGTKWLPGTIGGSYYPQGFYVWSGADWVSDRNAIAEQLETNTLKNQIRVDQSNVATTLGGVIDPAKEYLIDGIIDIGNISIEVPVGGINFKGYDFNLSKIITNESNHTAFTSPVGGSGDVLWQDVAFEITGTNSQLLDIVGATGNEAFEIARINFNNCTSLGQIDNYRQGLETGTGRFGGTPDLCLAGTWTGGYFIETSIVRGLADGAYSLFKAGVGFNMASRFRSNMNIDLPASASFLDFTPSNFANPSTLQLTEMIITRNGIFNALDLNITPNITKGDLVSNWSNNNGLPNTFEGGSVGVTTEAVTVINTQNVFETIVAGTWTALNLQHFDNPSGNQLRHLGNTPREYKIIANYTIDSSSNNELILRIRKFDDSEGTFSTVLDQRRQVNSLVGGRDVAFFNININVELDSNDYIELQIANASNTDNVTAELDSYHIVEER